MPRPKRTKIAPSVSASRAAKPSAQPKVAKDVVEDISDDGEGNTTRGRRIINRKPGGLSVMKEDDRGRVHSARAIGVQNVAAIEAARKKRDAALERLQAENLPSSEQVVSSSEDIDSSPPVEVGRRAPIESSILAVSNFRRRPRQPSILGRGAARARSSSIESNLAETDGLTGVRAMENSLARGHFRRRQRQPSILGRANSHVRSSSLGLEMDRNTPETVDTARNGVSRRGERQSSMPGTGTKKQERGEAYNSDEEDDFNPDDESTPLNLSKTRSTVEPASQSMSSASNPRKRKLSPLQAPPSSLPLPTDDNTSSRTSASTNSPHSAPAHEGARSVTPELFSETMAPPRSSSPPEVVPEVLRPSLTTNAQPSHPERRQPSRRVPAPPPDDDLPSSPPSLTHSPDRPTFTNRRQTRGPAKPKPTPANFATVQLQALLPRRRRRPPRDTFDVESSEEEVDITGLGSDDDELTHATIRTNRTTRSLAHRRVTKLKPGAKAGQPPPASSRKTYGSRRTTSDKENEQDGRDSGDGLDDVDPDDSLAPIADDTLVENSQELEQRVGKELKLAKRKFEVVDKWELDFEDVTASSSSPRDAR